MTREQQIAALKAEMNQLAKEIKGAIGQEIAALKKKQREESSFWDKTKRLGGVAAHGFAEGVGGLADLANMATRNMDGGFELENDANSPGYDLKSYETPAVSNILGNQVSNLFGENLKPDGNLENFTHLLGELSVPIPAAKAPKGASLFKKFLKHEGIAAGGAGGITAAENQGVESALGKMVAGAGGAAAASALGGLRPKAAALKMFGAGKNKFNLEAANAAKNIGVDVPIEGLTTSNVPRSANKVLQHFPWGPEVSDSVENAGKQYQGAFESLLDRVAPQKTVSLSKIANDIYANANNLLEKSTGTVDPTNLVEEVIKTEKHLKAPVTSTSTKNALSVFKEMKKNLTNQTAAEKERQKLIKDIDKLKLGEDAKSKILEIADKNFKPETKKIPIQKAFRLRQELNKIAADEDLFNRQGSDMRNYIRKAIGQTNKLIESFEDKDVVNAIQSADKEYAKHAKRDSLEKMLYEPLYDPMTGKPKYKQLVKMLEKKENQTKLINNLGEDKYKELRDHIETAKALDRIKPNNQHQHSLFSSLASAAAGLYGAPFYTAPILGATYAGKKLLTNPKLVEAARKNAMNPTRTLSENMGRISQDVGSKLPLMPLNNEERRFSHGGSAAQIVQSKGRGGDTILAHITPAEAFVLRQIGGRGTINPATGLREFSRGDGPDSVGSGGGGGSSYQGDSHSGRADYSREDREALDRHIREVADRPDRADYSREAREALDAHIREVAERPDYSQLGSMASILGPAFGMALGGMGGFGLGGMLGGSFGNRGGLSGIAADAVFPGAGLIGNLYGGLENIRRSLGGGVPFQKDNVSWERERANGGSPYFSPYHQRQKKKWTERIHKPTQRTYRSRPADHPADQDWDYFFPVNRPWEFDTIEREDDRED